MRCLVAVDAQLFITPDGRVWTKTIYGYNFWERYLDVFEDIVVVSRMKKIDYNDSDKLLLSSGERVFFAGLPMAIGAKAYLMNLNSIILAIRQSINKGDCAIIRLPSVSAMLFEIVYKRTKKPYALEIVADPKDAFKENKIARYFITSHLKKSVQRADGVSYVTQYALQKEYPSKIPLKANTKRFESYYSSIILKKSYFGRPKNYTKPLTKIRIVHTANNMNNYVKGHKTVIKLLRELTNRSLDATVCFIGDGSKRREFEEYSRELGVEDRVVFTGILASADEVRKELVSSDIFVFPTRAEGLPRAVIEAMAVGLPCLSTPVNGIPELLKQDYLFDPDDYLSFSNKICSLVNDPELLNAISLENIKKASEYSEDCLKERRMYFYSKLKKLVLEK